MTGYLFYLRSYIEQNELFFVFKKQNFGLDCNLSSLQHLTHREWLRPGEEELVQRFDPSSSLDTIGFFIAKFSVGSKET